MRSVSHDVTKHRNGMLCLCTNRPQQERKHQRGDIVTNIKAMECDSEEYDAVIGMGVVEKGDFAITNSNGEVKFSFQIPSSVVMDFTKQ